MVDVCVIIVTVNHRSFIGQCIDSVLSSECSCSVKLAVVDDYSVDGTLTILKKYSYRIQLIERDGGHSFSSNNNIILNNFNAKYFLLLNPDTILPKNGITNLYDFMESHQEAGACGPKLVYPDGSLQLSCRRFPTPLTFLLRRTPLRIFLHERARGERHLMAEWAHDEVKQVDFLTGACIILREKAIKEAGYFDERFRLYVEEIDLCYRLWKNGWSVYYNPNVVVVHDHKGESDKSLLSRYSLWHYQSMLHYVIKHGIAGFRRPKID